MGFFDQNDTTFPNYRVNGDYLETYYENLYTGEISGLLCREISSLSEIECAEYGIKMLKF
jgi:hypothetical protein